MQPLPRRPDLDQLKKQAKELLAAFRRGDPAAVARVQASLPAAASLGQRQLAELPLRLRDTQSCLAREHGFETWVDLKIFVEAARHAAADAAASARAFCALVYAGDIAGGMNRSRPHAAARLLAEHPGIASADPWLACAAANLDAFEDQIGRDPAWVHRPGGPLDLPPLVAATHSSLLRLAGFRERLHRIVTALIGAGADPNQSVASRWPPASLATPSPDHRLSALYGAAGQNHDADLSRQLLAAGADPNDGESLYHSLEAPACTRLLLDAGAVVTGTNALYRCLDFDDVETFRLLLSRAAGAVELRQGKLLLWAIRRRRSTAHVAAMLGAGVSPVATTRDGVSAVTQALRYGLADVAAMLAATGERAEISDADRFVAACARGDADAARHIQSRRPDFPAKLTESQLRILPELAETGGIEGVRTMIELGWPVDVRGGDWSASALNLAVFRGDGPMTRLLLEHGASWTEQHGFGDNVCGTLSWASLNEPDGEGDWVACAEALVEHGMPRAVRDGDDPDSVLVDGRRRRFSDEVSAVLLGEDA